MPKRQHSVLLLEWCKVLRFSAPPPSLCKWVQCWARSPPSPRACSGLVEWNSTGGWRHVCGGNRRGAYAARSVANETFIRTGNRVFTCMHMHVNFLLLYILQSSNKQRYSSFYFSSSTCNSGLHPSPTCCNGERRVSLCFLLQSSMQYSWWCWAELRASRSVWQSSFYSTFFFFYLDKCVTWRREGDR